MKNILSKKYEVQGRPPSEEEEFYYRWGHETMKNNILLLDDVLKQIITLNTALLAVAIGFLGGIEALSWSKSIVLILLTLSLLVSFTGILPYESRVDVQNPHVIKQHKRKVQSRKGVFLYVAVALFFCTFILLVIDFLT